MSMMGMTDRTTINTIRTTGETLGIKLPKAVTDALAAAAKIEAELQNLGKIDGALELAVSAALTAGRDPSSDPEVQRAVTAHALASNHGLGQSVVAAGAEQISAACRAHIDEIIDGWRTPFDAAALDLAEAYERIGGLPLDDTTSILAKGNDIADVWARATKATRTIDLILSAWTSLVQLTRATQINPRDRPLRLAPMTLEQWTSVPSKITAWEAMQHGLELDLPDMQEYRRRIAVVQQQAAQQVVEAQPINAEREGNKQWASKVEAARREVLA